MDKTALVKKLLSKKTKDYSYAIAFFLIFSFFLIAVIRPNILSVFSSGQRITQLEKQNKFYDSQIANIINIQSSLEANRDNLYLLKEAIAQSPQVNKVLGDINLILEKNKLTVDKINIGEINLKDAGGVQKLKAVSFQADVTGTFEDLRRLIDDLYGQRRLKLINDLVVSNSKDDKGASDSSHLKMKLNIEGYYL